MYLLAFLCLFGFKTLWDAGSFKTIQSHYEGTCEAIENISGPEDITILSNGLAFISSDNRWATLEGSPEQGNIFLFDLKNAQKQLLNLTPNLEFDFHPHGISVYENYDGTVELIAVNHRMDKQTIQIFHFDGEKLIHEDTIEDEMLISPNDLVHIDKGKFYVTNDHGSKNNLGKTFEDYLQLSKSNVLFYDGLVFFEVVSQLKYANGINISKDRTKIYITETIGKSISSYEINSDNHLSFLKEIYLDSGVDNIEIDKDNTVWIGSHPQVLKFVQHSKNKKNSPSQVIKITDIDNDYKIEEIYLNDGQELSGSSVASIFENFLLIGAVFEHHFLLCQKHLTKNE